MSLKILLIDCDPRRAEQLGQPLARAGHEILRADGGRQGLKTFLKERPALVLIEAMLQRERGTEVCKKIRRTPPGRDVPIILHSETLAGDELAHTLENSGCSVFLEMPCPGEQLLDVCEQLLPGRPSPTRTPLEDEELEEALDQFDSIIAEQDGLAVDDDDLAAVDQAFEELTRPASAAVPPPLDEVDDAVDALAVDALDEDDEQDDENEIEADIDEQLHAALDTPVADEDGLDAPDEGDDEDEIDAKLDAQLGAAKPEPSPKAAASAKEDDDGDPPSLIGIDDHSIVWKGQDIEGPSPGLADEAAKVDLVLPESHADDDAEPSESVDELIGRYPGLSGGRNRPARWWVVASVLVLAGAGALVAVLAPHLSSALMSDINRLPAERVDEKIEPVTAPTGIDQVDIETPVDDTTVDPTLAEVAATPSAVPPAIPEDTPSMSEVATSAAIEPPPARVAVEKKPEPATTVTRAEPARDEKPDPIVVDTTPKIEPAPEPTIPEPVALATPTTQAPEKPAEVDAKAAAVTVATTTAIPDYEAEILPEGDRLLAAEEHGPSGDAITEPEFNPPVALNRIAPSYSRKQLKGQEHEVILRVLVSEAGKVVRVVVKEGTRDSSLVASAIDAVLRFKYRPATENGESVRAWTEETLSFTPKSN